MNHAYIENQQVIDRYLMEKLSAVEARRFEAHYLDCRQCLDELSHAETFQQDFRLLAAQEAAQVTGAGLGILTWLARLSRSRQISLLAGALFVAVLLPAGLVRQVTEERQAREGLAERFTQAHQPQVNTLVFPLRQERNAGGTTEPSRQIALGASPEWIVLSLELDEAARLAARYRLTLFDAHQEEIWKTGDVEPDVLGALRLSLHSSWLQPGDYRLRAEALGTSAGPPDDPVSVISFSFRILART